ncbi:TetR/AcrR family transcriptional regulator [Jeotgalibacillus proteolyticus]|uniref:TetR family transcriptional regulator n=1 Tax=Jeotgalibacillus proteolyticus TaxID=2082395 RepID=A0A2S5GCY3_9BACL|nr:TetR/AcrR family transcriptional regulator [Jeotgalibacillus proteolyticus]PPA70775.1 TetR family transcriptional regulator [Jeotgalibacillus proteolyticus]
MNKKQLIMEKSLELFAQKGFEGVSIQQITDYCGISKGAFYLSFKSKSELIVALIDDFMMQIVDDIDHSVKNSTSNENLLYEFYFTAFHSTEKHSDITKILIKEETHPFNKDLLHKMIYFEELIKNTIIALVEKLYGDELKHMKYDLVYCIRGFIKTYSQFLLFHQIPVDISLLSRSLAEKTSLLARHSSIPFITKDLMEVTKGLIPEEPTKEQLANLLEQKISELENSVQKESLELLSQELLEPSLQRALIKGLIENIRLHPHCKEISYLLRNYFKM